jgi:hypothetical protein
MKQLLSVLCALSSVLCIPISAAEVTDLGQGLSYLRVHSIAGSDAALRGMASTGALVLDLRYATADDTAAARLRDALANRSAGSLLMVLVSPATPASLSAVIATSSALTLGAPGSVPPPKVTVQTEAAADRRAFDALDAGADLSKLITGRIEKDRFDEATLVQEFKSGNHDAEPPPLPDPADPKPNAKAAKETTPAVPTDRVLQRAVNLHRALLALKK